MEFYFNRTTVCPDLWNYLSKVPPNLDPSRDCKSKLLIKLIDFEKCVVADNI